MRIKQIQDGPHVPHSIKGSVLKIGKITIDLAKRQDNSQVIIDISRDGDTLVEGVGGKDGYVANIIIPPKEYEDVDTGRVDEKKNPIIERRALPLNISKVVMNSWQFKPIETTAETTIKGGLS